MGHPRDSGRDTSDEYHSYVMRVRARAARARAPGKSGLSIRVEHVNTRTALHFNELSGALDFIADSVRRNVLQPDP